MNEDDIRPSFVVLSVEDLRRVIREEVQALTTPEPSPLLTPAAVGKRLGVSSRTVQRLIAEGELPACRVGTQFRVRLDALEAWEKRDHDAA